MPADDELAAEPDGRRASRTRPTTPTRRRHRSTADAGAGRRRQPRRRPRPTTAERRGRRQRAAAPTGQAGRRARRVPRRAPRLQADFENYRSASIRQQTELSSGPPSRWSSGCCRCSTRSTWRRPRSRRATERRSARLSIRSPSLLRDTLGERGPRADRRRRRGLRPDGPRRRRPRPGDEGEEQEARRSIEVLRAGYRLKGRVLRPAMVQGPGLRTHGAAARVVRDRLLQGARRRRRRRPRRRSPAPTASWPSSSTRTPTPALRTASRRSRPPTTCSATRTSARSTTRSAASGRCRRLRRLAAPATAASTSVSTTSPTSSAGSSAAAAACAAAARPGCGPSAARDVEAELHLSSTRRSTGSPRRSTSRAAPPAAPAAAGRRARARRRSSARVCSGPGVLNDNQGLFSLSTPCPECRGRGTKVVDPCPTCLGTGTSSARTPGQGPHPGRRRRRPADPGQRPRRAGRNGGPAGDLYVTVHVAPHALFGRRGRDLTLTVPITFPEAALGATITVPSLDEPVTLKVPPGTKTGKTFRVPGAWHPTRASEQGDLLVTVEIVVPTELTDEQREAVEALAAATTTLAASAPRGVMSDGQRRRHDACDDARGLRHLGRRRARRRAPPDAAHLRAQGPARSGAHRRREPPLLATPTSTSCAASRS